MNDFSGFLSRKSKGPCDVVAARRFLLPVEGTVTKIGQDMSLRLQPDTKLKPLK